MLATNLVYIKSGKTIFFKGILNHREKWNIEWRDIIKRKYQSQKCVNAGCPYADKCQCKTLIHKLKNNVRKIDTNETYVELKEAQAMFSQFLEKAVSARENSLYLIKAQTAIGKTTTYCRLAENEMCTKKIMIVVPTIKLQDEVYDNLKKKGIEVRKTTNLEQKLYQWIWFWGNKAIIFYPC